MIPEHCSLCGKGWWPAKMRYTRKGMTTTVYAHKALDGKLHSITDTQYDPGAPDTPLPKRGGVSLAARNDMNG
jgi:hypothetical protein